MKFIAHLKSIQGVADLAGILLLLLVGYVYYSGYGQRLYWMDTPRSPVLLPMDWESSTMDWLSVGAEEEDSTVDPNSSAVKLSRIYDNNTTHDTADIEQTTTWYANIQDAKSAWQNSRKEVNRQTAYGYPFFPLNMDTTGTPSLLDQFYTIPVPTNVSIPSSIFCYDYPYYKIKRRTCIYFGYYEHWYTQILFGENMDRLNDKAMFDLIEKAVQIIKTAPSPKQ
jgi:hypothetical protein